MPEDYEKYRYKATATVKCEIEVLVSSTWGGDCTVAQIHKQAADQARAKVYALSQDGLRIVGHPNVTAVLVPRE